MLLGTIGVEARRARDNHEDYSIGVDNFRSVSALILEGCGSYNVLIGRNNAGKSTILAALYHMSLVMRQSSLILLDPPVGKQIDFYQRKTSSPITISATYLLSHQERGLLVDQLSKEMPQLTTAIEKLPSPPPLTAQIAISESPRFGWLHQITVHTGNRSEVLFKANAEVAIEMQQRERDSMDATALAKSLPEALQSMDDDDFVVLRGGPGADVRRARLVQSQIRRGAPSKAYEELGTLASQASSFEDFKEKTSALAQSIQSSVSSTRQNPLKNNIEYFGGVSHAIPAYVHNIREALSSLKVLYMHDRRAPIGRNEAARILELKTKRGGAQKLAEIRETVGSLLGVEIDAFAAEQPNTAELDIDEFLVDVNGAGIREALRIVLDYEFISPDVLIVEEPEMHLHPALEHSVARFLHNIGTECQVFVATHSTQFLNTEHGTSVYLISKTKPGGTEVQQLSGAGDLAKELPAELGLRLSSLFAVKFLAEKAKDSTVDVSKVTREDLDKALAEAAAETMPDVIERRARRNVCSPIYFSGGAGDSPSVKIKARLESARGEVDKRMVEVDAHVARVEAEVRGGWNDNWKTWVDGAAVLDRAFQRFGLRFVKERDSTRLAMYVAGIPAELRAMFATLKP